MVGNLSQSIRSGWPTSTIRSTATPAWPSPQRHSLCSTILLVTIISKTAQIVIEADVKPMQEECSLASDSQLSHGKKKDKKIVVILYIIVNYWLRRIKDKKGLRSNRLS